MPLVATGVYPMLSAWAVRHAAMLTSRSASWARPPEIEVNAATNPGTQPITSNSTSGRSTQGSIACTRLRRSIRLGGSGIAFRLATCSLPSSSTVTEGVGRQPAADVPVGLVQHPGMGGQHRIDGIGIDGIDVLPL